MAIAIIDNDKLQTFAALIDFPYDHRINLTLGGVGFEKFDEFIRKSIRWIPELEFRKDKHIKIWGSAKVTGPVPNPEDFYSRSVFAGTEAVNQFKPWIEQDAHEGQSPAHANFIGSVTALSLKYIVDFKQTESGKVDVLEYIRVIVSEDAENSYLGYGLEIPVEKLWNVHYKTDGKERFWLERSDFDSVQPFEDTEHFYVREVTNQGEINAHFTQDEDGVWKRDVKETSTVTDVEVPSLVGFEDTSESYSTTVLTDEATVRTMQATLKVANTMADIKTKIAHPAS